MSRRSCEEERSESSREKRSRVDERDGKEEGDDDLRLQEVIRSMEKKKNQSP